MAKLAGVVKKHIKTYIIETRHCDYQIWKCQSWPALMAIARVELYSCPFSEGKMMPNDIITSLMDGIIWDLC